MLVRPFWLMPRKLCGLAADFMALIATSMLPSVPFLKPTGVDRPLAISRWVCDSVVRAPIAYQLIRSARYWGESGSSASDPAGSPRCANASRSSRASVMPSSMRNVSSMCGSLMNPFQPAEVRGFSKYTRITRKSVSSTSRARACSRPAYSSAAFGSWIEQGPTTMNRRGSRRSRMSHSVVRPRSTVAAACSSSGRRSFTSSGVGMSSIPATLRLSTRRS